MISPSCGTSNLKAAITSSRAARSTLILPTARNSGVSVAMPSACGYMSSCACASSRSAGFAARRLSTSRTRAGVKPSAFSSAKINFSSSESCFFCSRTRSMRSTKSCSFRPEMVLRPIAVASRLLIMNPLR